MKQKSFFSILWFRGENTWSEGALLPIITVYIFVGCSRSKWWSRQWDRTNPKWGRRQILWQKYQRRQPTSIPEQEELSDSKVRSSESNSEEVSVTENLAIALEREKDHVKYPISQHACPENLSNTYWSFIVVDNPIETPTSIQEAMRSEHWTQTMRRRWMH